MLHRGTKKCVDCSIVEVAEDRVLLMVGDLWLIVN